METIKDFFQAEIDGERDTSPFIIAEMSGNHGASLEQALRIVDAAAQSGADALKLQTFTPDGMTLDLDTDDFKVTKKESLWYGRKLYDLFSEGQTPREWHKEIFDYGRSKGMMCFSSVFDETAVDFLETLDCPAYKIASFENVDLPLIKYVSATKKPLIISTGMANLGEIEDAVNAAYSAGCVQLTILQCTSSYPAPIERSNLNTIPHMKELFGCAVGLSDHTLGIAAPIAATALGASVIEKHITLDRNDGAVDSAFSLEPDDFKVMVKECRNASKALGQIVYGPTDAEMPSRSKRRSLYVVQDMAAGEQFTTENVRRIRPGNGLLPKFYDDILGRTARTDIKRGTPVQWNIVE